MRIVEPTLAMFVSETRKLEEWTFQVSEAAERYLQSKKVNGPNSYTTKEWRDILESRLMHYKQTLSRIYDIMHDRGLTNFESGIVENNPPKYHPLRIEPKLDDSELLLFAQIMRLNPTLHIRGLDGKSTINLAGSDGYSETIDTEETARNEVSTTDLQSSGVTGASSSLQGESKESDHKREDTDAYALADFLL